MRTAIVALALAATPPIPPGPLDSYPAPSPNGSALLFVSSRGGEEALWIATTDGRSPRLFFDGGTAGKEPGGPVWSPDGKTIAFAMRPVNATRDDETDIFTANADGTNLRRLTSTPGDDSHPHWSADGRRIFFNSARATPDLSAEWGKQWIDVYSMASNGSDVRRITDCKSICTYPVPSPDGRSVVHRRTYDGPGFDWGLNAGLRNSEVVVTSIDGKVTRNLSNSPAYDGWPTWAKDGRWIIFVSNRKGQANTGQLFAIRPDGSGLTQLTDGIYSRVQPWPDAQSRHLYFAERMEDDAGGFGRIAAIPLDLPPP